MVGIAETAGTVVITMAILQGLFKLIGHLIDRTKEERDSEREERIIEALTKIEEKFGNKFGCGLNEKQSSQLNELYVLHTRVDRDGTPLWYFPRSWAETQKEIVDKLQSMANINYKMRAIIEGLEKRIERFDQRD